MSVRETKLIVVTGRKRIGKSNETIRILYNEYIRGVHARKALIFDPNNEYGAYEMYDRGRKTIINVAVLGHNDILQFNKQKMVEIRRIVPINKYGYPLSPDEQDELIVKMMTEFRGGCLCIEDLNTVFGDSLPKKVSGFFSNNAHRDCDIIIQMQSIGRILPKMWQNTQVIRFHAQLDSVDQSKGKLKEDYEIFKISQLMVNYQYEHGNVRFFVYVDKEDKKIRGSYSKAMFEKAVMDYLGENDWLVKKEMNRVDFNTGKKKYTAQMALDSVKNKLTKEYCTA
jgi:hypothetical protein